MLISRPSGGLRSAPVRHPVLRDNGRIETEVLDPAPGYPLRLSQRLIRHLFGFGPPARQRAISARTLRLWGCEALAAVMLLVAFTGWYACWFRPAHGLDESRPDGTVAAGGAPGVWRFVRIRHARGQVVTTVMRWDGLSPQTVLFQVHDPRPPRGPVDCLGQTLLDGWNGLRASL